MPGPQDLMKNRRLRLGLTVTAVLGLALAVGIGLRLAQLSRSEGLMQDLRAGLAARSIEDPDARLRKYLEGRYGDLDDPAVRQRVFVDFFNPERIKTLQILVKRAPDSQRQASIDAMARWIAGYRASLTPEDRSALGARYQSPEGRAELGRATAQYNAQDVQYRGSTAPVISELLRTLNELNPTQ
jgi:hypothetical protein